MCCVTISRSTGPKFGCGLGECGACTVIMDGAATRSCVIPAAATKGAKIVTLEGLGTIEKPHPVQKAFIEEQAAQCGYCINGMIMTAAAFLKSEPHPTRAAIISALNDNLCRCGTHMRIVRAIERGVPEERLAQALGVNVSAIQRRARLMDGVCPEAQELLKDAPCPLTIFDTLRKMGPLRQVEAAELDPASQPLRLRRPTPPSQTRESRSWDAATFSTWWSCCARRQRQRTPCTRPV